MTRCKDIMISVKPVFVDRMLSGSKTVELRRRKLSVTPGTRVWIYKTAPSGVVAACAEIERVESGSPAELWRSHCSNLGISVAAFYRYLNGRNTAYAVVLKNIQPVRQLTLNALRNKSENFHPPQFFRRIYAGQPELRALRRLIR